MVETQTPEKPAGALGDGIALVVGMDYPGAVISVGHCYRHANGRKYLHKKARHWRDSLADSLGWSLYENGLKGSQLVQTATVRIDAHYRDEAHATDPNNLCKLVYDAVEAATGINDRHMQPERGIVAYGVIEPSIHVTVTVWRDA